MAKPYSILNRVSDTLAVEFVHGTDTTMVLSSAASFDSGGGYIGVTDGAEWALYEYTGISTNTLTGLTPCTLGLVESTSSHTFAVGSSVEIVTAAEYISDLRSDVVPNSLFDANTVLAATADNTPAALTVPEQTLVGRITSGAITALNATQVRTLLNVADGADVTGSNAPQAHKDSHDPEDGSDAIDTAAPAEIAAVQDAAVGSSHSLARADHVHQIQHGITNNHIVTVDQEDAASGEYAKFTANGLESRSKAELLSDINVADGADVTGSNAPQTHKDSHDPDDGSDALDTAAAAEISAVVAAGVGSSHSFARADHVHAINHGITDNHIVTIDSADVATGEYAKFTANGLESKALSEVRSDLGVTNVHYLRGCVPAPADYYTNVDTEICLWPATDAAITITKIQITCDADPTTELDLDLKWADAFIGLANAAVVDVCDTTNGALTITSGFDDATIASGKCLYWSFGAEPDSDITQFAFTIEYTYD